MTKKIFAAGYFGYGNFGDELILDIFTKRMSGFRVTHVRRMKTKPFTAIAKIISSGAVVFPGGSVFQDETSSLSLFFYASVIFTAALFRKPIFLLDSGFEVRKPLNKKILRLALRLASFISVRDSASFRELRSLGLNPLKSADCAFSLEPLACRGVFPPETIGVIPRGKNDSAKQAMTVCEKKWPDAEFKFAVLRSKDLGQVKRLAGESEPVIIKDLTRAEKFLGECDFFILAPYHALVLASAAGAAFTALPYSRKITNFLTDTGMESRIFADAVPDSFDKNNKIRAQKMSIAEECAFQIFLNLLKDKLTL